MHNSAEANHLLVLLINKSHPALFRDKLLIVNQALQHLDVDSACYLCLFVFEKSLWKSVQ